MTGYLTSEFKVILGLFAACLAVYFYTDAYEIWALIVTAVALSYQIARTLTKKHRVILQGGKLTELIVFGIGEALLCLPLYQNNIERIFWLGCACAVGISYVLSRGNSKALPIQQTVLIHR